MREKRELSAADTITAVALIAVFVLATRVLAMKLLGQPVYFAPMDALALFCGCYLGFSVFAFVLPLAAIVISDQVINLMFYSAPSLSTTGPFYPGWYWQYVSYILLVVLGAAIKPSSSAAKTAGISLVGSVAFFLLSNFGVWFSTPMYPATVTGLAECLTMGLPFLKQTIAADLFFCAVFFGSFELLRRQALTPARARA